LQALSALQNVLGEWSRLAPGLSSNELWLGFQAFGFDMTRNGSSIASEARAAHGTQNQKQLDQQTYNTSCTSFVLLQRDYAWTISRLSINWVSLLDIYKPSSQKTKKLRKLLKLINPSDRLGFGQSLVSLDPSKIRSLSSFAEDLRTIKPERPESPHRKRT
jgi:hypothetical protein